MSHGDSTNVIRKIYSSGILLIFTSATASSFAADGNSGIAEPDDSKPFAQSTKKQKSTDDANNSSNIELFKESVRLMRAHENQRAEDALSQLVQRMPVAEAYLNYSLILLRLGKIKLALEQLEKAYKLKPDNPHVLLSFARTYTAAGMPDKALEKYGEFLQKHKSFPAAQSVASERDRLKEESLRINSLDKKQVEYLFESPEEIARWTKESMPLSIYIENVGAENASIKNTGPDKSSSAQMPGAVSSKNGTTVDGTVAEQKGGVAEQKASVAEQTTNAASSREGSLKEQIEEAYRNWALASGGKFEVKFVNKPEEAVIRCGWTGNPAELANPQEGGETLLSKNSDGSIRSAQIKILILRNNALAVKAAILHETGHSLGLEHSSRPGDAMFAYFNADAFSGELSKRDRQTIKLLYSRSIDDLRKLASAEKQKAPNKSPGLLESTPDSPILKIIALNKQAAKAFSIKDYATAVKLLEEAVSLKSDMTTIQENLARAYLLLSDQRCAAEDYREGELFLSKAATLFQKLGKKHEAQQAYSDLISLSKLTNNSAGAMKYAEKLRELE